MLPFVFCKCMISITSCHKKKIIIFSCESLASYKNLEINDFYSLLKHSKVLLGNSSCGILECGFIKKFVINLGIRQEGRVCEKNVYHISHSSKKILKKIKELLKKPNPKTKSKLYGSGNSSKKIVSTILNLDLKKNLIRKKFVI